MAILTPELRNAVTALARVQQAIREIEDRMEAQTVQTLLVVAASTEPPTLRDIQEKLGYTSGTATRNITTLGRGQVGKEGLDLVETYEDAIDRRNKRIRLTSKGEKAVKALVKALEGTHGKTARG